MKGTLCGLRLAALATTQAPPASGLDAVSAAAAAARLGAACARRVAQDTQAASTKADTPELVSTTSPPAKSSTPSFASQPPG